MCFIKLLIDVSTERFSGIVTIFMVRGDFSPKHWKICWLECDIIVNKILCKKRTSVILPCTWHHAHQQNNLQRLSGQLNRYRMKSSATGLSLFLSLYSLLRLSFCIVLFHVCPIWNLQHFMIVDGNTSFRTVRIGNSESTTVTEACSCRFLEKQMLIKQFYIVL